MSEKSTFNAWRENLSRLYDAKQYADAIASARVGLAASPESAAVVAIAAACLIDAGNRLGDLGAVGEAKQAIQAVLPQPNTSDKLMARLKYYLSNAFAAEYFHYLSSGDREKAREALRDQRRNLQEVLLQEHSLPHDLRVKVHTNCANALDETDRTIEAIDHYVLAWALDHKHMLAKGNCGVALYRLARFTRNHSMENLDTGLQLLEEACSCPEDIERYASATAVGRLEQQRGKVCKEVETRMRRRTNTTLEAWRTHRQEEHGSPECAPYMKSVLKNRLLLSLNQFPLPSAKEAIDDLMFAKLGSAIDDESQRWAVDIIHRLNLLKEEFATARYLYYLSAEKPAASLVAAEGATQYADPGYATEFSVASGILKASFRTAVDVLDKIGYLLSTYLKLEHKERRVYFNTVWYLDCDRKKGEHPLVAETKTKGRWLRVLHELQEDWFAERFPGPFQSLRHVGTHRGLILSTGDDVGQAVPGARSVDEHRVDALLMLRCVKAALVYLFLFIDEEEKRRGAGDVAAGVMPLPMK